MLVDRPTLVNKRYYFGSNAGHSAHANPVFYSPYILKQCFLSEELFLSLQLITIL